MPLDTGKITGNPLKRSIMKQLHSKQDDVVMGAVTGVDCAFFAFEQRDLVTAQFTAMVSFKDNIAEIAGLAGGKGYILTMPQLLDAAVGRLQAAGAEPVAAQLSVLLPEGTEEPELRELIKQADRTAKALGIQLAGVQGTVSPYVAQTTATAFTIGTQGIGEISGPPMSAAAACSGQDIVLTKWIGLEGTAILAARHRDKLLERLPEYFVNKAEEFEKLFSIIPEAALARKSGACAMHPLGEGGVLAALWELAEASGVGLTIDMKKIPLKQETVEVCEICGVNPYQLLSFGSLMIITEDGEALVDSLEQAGIRATIIGTTNDSKQRIITNEDETRFLDRPQADEIYNA